MLLPGTASRKIWKLNSWDVLLRSPSFLFKSCGFLIRRGFKSILQSFITDGISIFFFLLMKKIIYFSVFKLSWWIDIKNKFLKIKKKRLKTRQTWTCNVMVHLQPFNIASVHVEESGFHIFFSKMEKEIKDWPIAQIFTVTAY